MSSNPMQRKVRNSFLLGILTMLLIVIFIGVIVFFVVIKPNMDAKKAEEAIEYVSVYQLTTSVSSGSEISAGMAQMVTLPKTNVPADAMTVFPTDVMTEAEAEKTKVIAKVNLGAGTILTPELIALDESELDDSLRLVEYNMITLPVTIAIGETIDIRLSFSNGQDLIVVSKKEIMDIQGNAISVYLTESEILMMNSAIVEAYIMPASNLYVSRYTEPGMQESADTTYVPTDAVRNLIANNSNITNDAKTALGNRFVANTREHIQSQVNQYAEEALLNIETGIQEQIEAARTARENYLSGMTGY